jgi:hypothetical protein
MTQRRHVVSLLAGGTLLSALPQLASAGRAKPGTPPVWLGAGLNASALAAASGQLFPVLSQVAQRNGQRLTDARALTWITQRVAAGIREDNPVGVRFLTGSQSLQRDETTGLSLVYDSEMVNALPTTMEDGATFAHAYYLVCATGLISILDGNGFWRILGAFPFYLKQALDGGRMERNQVEGWSVGAATQVAETFHTGAGPSIRSMFVNRTKRFANWKDGYNVRFVRVLPVQIAPGAADALRQFRIDRLLTAELVGVIASSELCSGLDIGVLPYANTDALNRFQFQVADYGNLPQQPPPADMIDLRVRITVDLVRREVQPVQRQGFVHVRRGIRLVVEFLDLDNKTIAALRTASVDADRLFSIDDSTPSRDFQFFESALEKAISNLFHGIRRRDKAMLAAVGVNFDEVRPQIEAINKAAENLR